jgi:hypothetical protein
MSAESPLTRRAFLTLRRRAERFTAPDADAPDFALSSDELACAQIAEARPFLADEARRHGIPTENRTELEILRDVFAKAH